MVVDCEIRDLRERVLNVVLGKAWHDFATALGEGRAPEIETEYSDLVKKILEDKVPHLLEAVEIEGSP
jgi:hypothetical protein